MTRLAFRAGSAALVATAGMILLQAPAAHAAAPDRTGWWSQAQPSSGAVPNVTSQPGQLEVAGSPGGPVAFAAIHYTVPTDSGGQTVDPSQASGTLTLTVAPNNSAQGASIQLCPTTSQWKQAEDGAMADAPKYNCPGTPVQGQLSPDGNTMTWNLASGLMSQPGEFDVAIVPSGQAPFMVNFAKPDDTSVKVDAPPGGASSPAEPPVDTGSAATSLTPATAPPGPTLTPATPSLSVPVGPTGSPLPPPSAAPAAAAAPPPSGGSPSLGLTPVHHTSGFTTARRQQVMSVGLLLAIAGALWWMGGATQRAPRLLGSLGGRGPEPVVAAVRVGGVGRFARPRTAAPRPI
ncbi:MAG TPA: hypothetical protein VKI64_11160 [Acidimicrobiales bacterium]|nr:hypothetical protein [Acidimicrobiales bacterium]